MMRGMGIDMNDAKLQTLAPIRFRAAVPTSQ